MHDGSGVEDFPLNADRTSRLVKLATCQPEPFIFLTGKGQGKAMVSMEDGVTSGANGPHTTHQGDRKQASRDSPDAGGIEVSTVPSTDIVHHSQRETVPSTDMGKRLQRYRKKVCFRCRVQPQNRGPEHPVFNALPDPTPHLSLHSSLVESLKPPWRQPRGKTIVALVDTHANATSKR